MYFRNAVALPSLMISKAAQALSASRLNRGEKEKFMS